MRTIATGRKHTLAALLGLALLPLLFAGCFEVTFERSGQSSGTPPPASTEPVPEVRAVEEEITAMINERRRDAGLDVLVENYDLIVVARNYSCRMLNEGFFAHESPDGDTVAERVAPYNVDYRYLGENLAFRSGAGGPTPEVIVQGWMDSEGHRENILREDYTETGVGVCTAGDTWYYTQLFMRPR